MHEIRIGREHCRAMDVRCRTDCHVDHSRCDANAATGVEVFGCQNEHVIGCGECGNGCKLGFDRVETALTAMPERTSCRMRGMIAASPLMMVAPRERIPLLQRAQVAPFSPQRQ